MRGVSIIRKLDNMGRIVLPKDIRKALGIDTNDSIEFLVDSDSIVLKKYLLKCIFCGNTKNLNDYKGNTICYNCIELI